MSPNYNLRPYPLDTVCTYVFRGVSPLERVQLVFVDFDLTYQIGDPMDPYE